MVKSKDRQMVGADVLRPYVKRAMEDPELREDLLAAFLAARGLYGQVAKKRGMKAKAAKVSEKDFQEQIAQLVSELSTASDKLQGKAKRKSHKMRNRAILLTGFTLGVLYNPWTGQATREWIMERVAGDGSGLDTFAEHLETEGGAAGNGGSPSEETAQAEEAPAGEA